MSKRETYRCLFPVFLLIILLGTGKATQAQQSILDREVNLSQNTGEIADLLKEIGRKGKFSFTYTSQIQPHRMASVLLRKQKVSNHLKDIFRYDSIQFIEKNKKIILVPLQKKPPVILGFRSVKGIALDEKTQKPLPYTTVFLLNKSTGTIANGVGRFEFKITNADSRDTLGFSYIGYRLVTIPVVALDSSSLIIKLSAEKVQIKEVVVKPLDPIYILTKAIERIAVNYDRKPSMFTGFFRESTMQDNKKISLSEAVINIFKEPYTSSRNDQVKIYKGRKGNNIDEKEFIEFVVQGGLYNTFQLDIVKNLPTFLDADYFTLYNYNVEKVITHLQRLTYVIAFEQREDVKYPCYKGRIYIDVGSLAIVGATFEMPETGMSYASGIYVKKSPRKIGVKPISAHYQVFYRYYCNKWNLSNARSDVLIRVRRRKDKHQDKYNSEFESISEFVITSKDTANIARFKTDEISRPRDILVEQIGQTDPDFWGNENIIIPEEPIEKTIVNIGRKNSFFSGQEIKSVNIEEEKEVERSSNKSESSEDDNTGNESKGD
jgi:hypothetical protein